MSPPDRNLEKKPAITLCAFECISQRHGLQETPIGDQWRKLHINNFDKNNGFNKPGLGPNNNISLANVQISYYDAVFRK
jgi:hypothetical protein